MSGRRPRPSRRALQWPPAESASRAADHWASAAQFVWRCKTLHVRQAREWSFRLVTRSVNVAAVLDSTFWLGISMEQSVPQGALDLEDQFFDVDPQQEWTFAVDSGQFCLAPLQW